jgi:hypothetical protein
MNKATMDYLRMLQKEIKNISELELSIATCQAEISEQRYQTQSHINRNMV